VASTLVWDRMVESTDDVYDTISTALGCWMRLAPGRMTAAELEVCIELALGEWASVLFYIFFYYIMSEPAVQDGSWGAVRGSPLDLQRTRMAETQAC
jgi:hypothetical protein